MERQVYYHDLSEERSTWNAFYELSERYDFETHNIGDEDVSNVIEQLKGFVKKSPRYLEPYIWLEEIYFRNRRKRSADAIFEKACDKAFKMVLSREKKWPDEMSWGDMENRTLIRIFLRKGERLWHLGQNDHLLLDQALNIYLNLLNSNPYDQPCARIYALAILEGISNNDFYDEFMDYDEYGDYVFVKDIFAWFEQQGPKHTALLKWFDYAKKEQLL
jgi:hypothetical protein